MILITTKTLPVKDKEGKWCHAVTMDDFPITMFISEEAEGWLKESGIFKDGERKDVCEIIKRKGLVT